MRIVATLAAATAAALSAAPAVAEAHTKAECHAPRLRQSYVLNFHRVERTFGRGAAGHDFHRTRRCSELGRSVRTFRRWLNQDRAVAMHGDRTPTRHRTSPRNTGGLYAIPSYIVWRESRGSYFARNPSGAFGAYQLMPFHFAGGGECAGLGTGPAGQDACAAILWNGPGGSQHWAATR